jgi:hypothetical protein
LLLSCHQLPAGVDSLSFHRRRVCRHRVATRAQPSDPSSETASRAPGGAATSSGSTGAALAASTLDAAASAFAALRRELPYVTSGSVVADDVRYSFGNGLVQCKGRDAYVAQHRLWRDQVPRNLGRTWKVRLPARVAACMTLALRSAATDPGTTRLLANPDANEDSGSRSESRRRTHGRWSFAGARSGSQNCRAGR